MLPVARYRFTFQVETELHLNFYSGSMLRGAFGHALKKVSCLTLLPACKDCPLYQTCSYTRVFEAPAPAQHSLQNFSQIPNPYVIEPPPLGAKTYAPGERLQFNMVLMGHAISQLPLIIFAWKKALEYGLGKARSRAALQQVHLLSADTEPQAIFDQAHSDQLYPYKIPQPTAIEAVTSATLRFYTPLRLKQQGKIASSNLQASSLLMALARRYHLLEEFHTTDVEAPDFGQLKIQAQQIEVQHQLKWCDWQRYSNRQQQSMKLGGVVGEVILRGSLQPFMKYLNAGELLHVGGKTTFGMGGYQLQTESV